MKKVRILTKKQAKSERAKSEWAKSEWPKSEEAKSEWPKSEQAKSERAKSEGAKSEQAKSEQAKSEQLKFPQITASSMELFFTNEILLPVALAGIPCENSADESRARNESVKSDAFVTSKLLWRPSAFQPASKREVRGDLQPTILAHFV